MSDKPDLVKVMFRLEQDEDGFPPEKWEGIWAKPLKNGTYQIDNIPFFAMDVSDGDIVRASVIDGELRFVEVVTPSDNCTVRIIIYDLQNEESIRERIKSLCGEIEGTGIEGLLSISVPSKKYQDLSHYLDDAFTNGLLDYQESALRYTI